MQHHHDAARKQENFPVAAFWLPKVEREAIFTFYDYVRGLDDIADDGSQPAEARQRALFDAAGEPPSLHAAQLLKAFVQDTEKTRYANWDELMSYCRLSAMPVGRFLLELWGETGADTEASDALCAVLQILNHLQDVKADYAALDRIYLPQDMMTKRGAAEAMLTCDQMTPQLRGAVDDVLSACVPLLEVAKRLPASVRGFRARLQARWVVHVARRLHRRLQKRDVLMQHVTLSRWEYALAVVA